MHQVSRAELIAAIGKPCAYCEKPMAVPTRDHVLPRVHGGTLDGPNKVLACYRCNQDKGCSSLRKWLRRLRRAADPRAEIVARLLDRSIAPRRLDRWRGVFLCPPCAPMGKTRLKIRGRLKWDCLGISRW